MSTFTFLTSFIKKNVRRSLLNISRITSDMSLGSIFGWISHKRFASKCACDMTFSCQKLSSNTHESHDPFRHQGHHAKIQKETSDRLKSVVGHERVDIFQTKRVASAKKERDHQMRMSWEMIPTSEWLTPPRILSKKTLEKMMRGRETNGTNLTLGQC